MKVYMFIFLSVLAAACGGSEENVAPTLPTNLALNVTVNSDGSGKIDVVATADKTNYYEVYFGDTSPETPLRSADGSESHTYTKSGTYTVRVEAHATTSAFVDKSQPVEIKLKTDVNDDGYTTPETYSGMTLAWRDEFSGTAVNQTDWIFETGGGGWGNQELETYTTNNVAVADGYLTITAKKEGSTYTSTRMKTAGKKTFQYGRIDIRAKLPTGQGIWPALWMLGSNFDAVGWPRCGEIDIMEMIGGSGREKTVYGTPHWYESPTQEHASFGGEYSLSSGTFADKFHVFTIIWDASKIAWYVDDQKFHEIDITPANLSEFKASYYFIFNIAVGGIWPGNPDGSTVFPQRMMVDYVRVFQPS